MSEDGQDNSLCGNDGQYERMKAMCASVVCLFGAWLRLFTSGDSTLGFRREVIHVCVTAIMGACEECKIVQDTVRCVMPHIYAKLLIKSQMCITARDHCFESVAFDALREVTLKQICLLLWDFPDRLNLADMSPVPIDSLYNTYM